MQDTELQDARTEGDDIPKMISIILDIAKDLPPAYRSQLLGYAEMLCDTEKAAV